MLTGQTQSSVNHKLVKRDFSVYIPSEIFFLFFLAGRLYCGEFSIMLILIFVACLTLRGHEAGLLYA